MRSFPTLVLLAASISGVLSAQGKPPSEETIEFFRQNCSSCHTIGGGRLAGPDLKDVTKRQKREWLRKFIQDPRGTIDGGDPYAQKLFKAAAGVYMQQVPGINDARADKLLDLIEAESVAAKPLFAGSATSDRPLTDADIQRGRGLFTGSLSLAGGGPPCISCHTVHELSGFGGGRLGPDLTNAYARLDGRKVLAAWLAAPPSDVMRPIYKKHRIEAEERLALVAFLKKNSEAGEEASVPLLEFVLAGFGVAALILVLFDFLWRTRYRGVRRSMVKGRLSRSQS